MYIFRVLFPYPKHYYLSTELRLSLRNAESNEHNNKKQNDKHQDLLATVTSADKFNQSEIMLRNVRKGLRNDKNEKVNGPSIPNPTGAGPKDNLEYLLRHYMYVLLYFYIHTS